MVARRITIRQGAGPRVVGVESREGWFLNMILCVAALEPPRRFAPPPSLRRGFSPFDFELTLPGGALNELEINSKLSLKHSGVCGFRIESAKRSCGAGGQAQYRNRRAYRRAKESRRGRRVIQNVGGVHAKLNAFGFTDPETFSDIRIQTPGTGRFQCANSERALRARQRILKNDLARGGVRERLKCAQRLKRRGPSDSGTLRILNRPKRARRKVGSCRGAVIPYHSFQFVWKWTDDIGTPYSEAWSPGPHHRREDMRRPASSAYSGWCTCSCSGWIACILW